MKLLSLTLATLGLLACQRLTAQNPYLPLWEYIPDGEPYVFEDPDLPGQYRVYVYGSHDDLKDKYCGRDQVVWSASVDDLTHWRFDGTIFVSDRDAHGRPLSYDGQGDILYAPDVAVTYDAAGRPTYYLYPNNQSGGRNGMVCRSARPDGPFEVINWSRDTPTETVGSLRFDPAVFVDDDSRVYGYWGFEHSYAAELDPHTMSTVRPGTPVIDLIPGYKEDSVFRFFEASSIRKIKDKYVFIYSRWTRDGEEGLWESNYTLAYAWSNHPLGPYTYGGTIIDARAREQRPDGTTIATAVPNGNTHGSICEIGGQWYVFYHRQSGTHEFCRQAMVAPISVDVTEGPEGTVRISEAEYTSEGFQTAGLDPLQTYPAGIACYYVGPKPAHQEYPNVIYPGSHPDNVYADYVGLRDPYDLSVNVCPMVNNTAGSTIGYKYFNLSRTQGAKGLKLVLDYLPEGVDGTIRVYLDHPKADGGKLLATLQVNAKEKDQRQTARLDVSSLTRLSGKHALYLSFDSAVQDQSICQLCTIGFAQ